MSKRYVLSVQCLLLFLFIFPVNESLANVPFKLSIKFIVDEFGSRPTGAFNTDDQVYAQEALGNEILATQMSELRMQITEIIDLPTTLSAYSMLTANAANRDIIRDLALADPVTWAWRTNSINVYVTGSGSAWSSKPPNNEIIIMGQGVFDMTLLHESGHNLDLRHTHNDGGNDGCDDTINDDSAWTSIDDMANNEYGKDYVLLTVEQQYIVDMTWHNVMSYHDKQNRNRLTPCQKDRISGTASDDRSWLLSRTPLYVHPVNSASCSGAGSCNGTWENPYPGFQDALNSGSLTGKAIVLEKGNYSITQTSGINDNAGIYTRQGTSKINREDLSYELPVDLGRSKNSAVSTAVKQAQRQATLSRRALRDGNTDAVTASAKDRDTIKDLARQKSKGHKLKVIQYYLQAEPHATGNEKLAIQMELGRRYWHNHNYQQCHVYFSRVAANTDQVELKVMAAHQANKCKKKITK